MTNKLRMAFTRDLFNKDGNFIMPGPVAGFDMVMNWYPRWTRHSFESSEQLVSIHRVGVGYDKIDLAAATEAGVMLCIRPKSNTRPMALTVLTYLLALSMRIRTMDKLTRDGRWQERTNYYGVGLTGKTLGLI